jgi:opacity protein-like surface antigen
MRKLLATVALAGFAASAGGAHAQGLFAGGQWYVKGFGGATWPSGETAKVKFDGTPVGDGDLDYDTGYVLGAAVGYDFTANVAFELEYAYRKADTSGDTPGDGSANAFMLNALYNFDPLGAYGQIQPYVGLGLGVANYELHANGFGDFKTDGDLAYQAIGGVSYNLTPQWSLLGEVRWFAIDTGRLDGPGGFSIDTDYQTFDFLVGASYSF